MGQYADLFEDDAPRQRASLNLRFGIEANPDVAARDGALAKRFGLPAGVIAEFRPEYEARAKTDDAMQASEQSPKLRGWLAGDHRRAEVSHDDLGSLSSIESAIRWLVSAPGTARGGLVGDIGTAGNVVRAAIPGFSGKAYGALAAPFGLADQAIQAMDDAAAALTGTKRRQIAGTPGPEGFLLNEQKAAQQQAQALMPDMTGWSPEARGLVSGLRSGIENLLTLPLGLVGGEAAMLGTMGAVTFGESYGKGREGGLGALHASAYGLEDATAEIITEKYFGAAGLLKNIKAGASAGKLVAYELLRELPGEVTATVWQNFNEWANLHPEKSVGDFMAEQPDAIRETIVATLVGGGVQIGAVKGIERATGVHEKRQAQAAAGDRAAQALTEIATLAEASKLRERDPEAFGTFAQELTDASTPNLYINAQVLNQSGVDMQAVAQALPSVAAQVQQAIATGGDLVIPTAEFLTLAPGQDFMAPLIEHARTGVDAMSAAEGKAYMAKSGDTLLAEIGQVLADKQGDDAFQASHSQVRDGFLAQLNEAGRWTPDVNQRYAAMLGSFYAVQAAKMGVTPAELAARYPLRITATAGHGGLVLDQGQNDQTGAVDEATGLPLNSDGTVTVYHHTSAANATDIRRTGRLQSAGEPDLYFTTTAETNTGYGDTAVAFRVKPQRLLLDDEFSNGRKDFRVETKNASKARRVRFLPDGAGALEQAAFHGTPHRGIAKFSTENIGTGEGNQAFGWGLYFAGKQAVAEHYRKTLADATSDSTYTYKGQEYRRGSAEWKAVATLKNDGKREAVKLFKEMLADAKAGKPYTVEMGGVDFYQRMLDVAQAHTSKDKIGEVRGQTYQVDLPEDSKMLDFNKDWASQSKQVRDALTAAGVAQRYRDNLSDFESPKETRNKAMRGENIYAFLAHELGSEKAASQYLDSLGIPGMKYKGGTIAGVTNAGHNYVVFHGDHVQVTRALYQSAPTASITGAEFGGEATDTDTLRAAASAWYESTLRGSSVVNAASGRKITFGRGGKAFGRSADPVKIRLFAALPDLLKSGRIVESTPPIDPSKESNVKAYHWLVGDVAIGDQAIKVGVTIREDNRGNLYFNHNVVKEKAQGAEELGGTAHKAGAGTKDPRALEQTVAPAGDGINLTVLNKDSTEGPRGQIAFAQDITAAPSIITLLPGADLSTFIHEAGHFFLQMQADMAARIQAQIDAGASVTDGERGIVDDMNRLLAWFGVKGSPEQSVLDEWHGMTLDEQRAHHETFARGFEAYAFEGKSPSIELQGVFQRFRAWLLSVYKSAKDLNVELTDEVRGVMDRMLASTQQIQDAEAARGMGALFKTPEQSGMTPEQWRAYHDLAVGATAQAIDRLQTKGLKDMQWLQGARGRKLKELQKRADGLRREVRGEVRSEVMAQPVYRAWAFLTGKGADIDTAKPDAKAGGQDLDPSKDSLLVAIAKLGGINRESAQRDARVHPDYHRTESGVFGKPVFRKDGGRSADAMAEALAEAQYLPLDENGQHSLHELEQAIADELGGQPRYSLWHDYAQSMGEEPVQALPEHVLFGKLDTAVLRDMYGAQADAVWRKLSTLRMTSEASGLHPDVVAETFGFSSGDELVQALAADQPPRQVIEAQTDRRMLERFGDLATPEGLKRATDAAIHTEARARFIATELDALQRAGRVREAVPGQRNTADVLARAAKAYADGLVAKLKVRDIRPGQYQASEARAARAAEKAFKAGDTTEAAAQKRNQLIQNAAARAAGAAQTEMDKARDYFRRFDKRVKSIDAGYQEQIDGLLERFDLRQRSLKAIDRASSLADWVQSQVDQGIEPDIDPALLNEARRVAFKDMTVEEVRGLVDAVRQIEHLGRLKNRLLTSRAKRDFEAARDELVASIEAHAGDRQADTRTPATVLGKKLQALRNFGAAHIKAATWARVFDGGKDGGPVWEYFIRPANDRADMETTMRAKATEDLTRILAPVLAQKGLNRKTHFASVNRSFTRQEVFSMALNTGNAGNIQRMLSGEGWTQAQLQPMLATLTADEWRAVQGVWDHFETYRPEIAAKERRVYGREPNWVDPQAFDATAAGGEVVSLRGGYYPIKYDPAANNRAEQHSDAESAKRQLQGAYTSATTRRGFTKNRAAEVRGRPLLYSLAAVYSGVNDVIHDLAWHEWLIDVNKLLRSDKIDEAIRSHYGPAVVRQFKTWAQDIAAGEGGLQVELDSTLGRLRHGVSIAGLGFNAMSAAMQPLGLSMSMVRVGAGWIGKGLGQYITSPIASTRKTNDLSEFMASRSRTRFRELAELRNQVEGQTPAREVMGRYAYWMMMRAQQMVDVPTWLGAHEKAISEGNSDERAVALADQAVIDAQGGGQTKDLSAIERGGPAQKLFTVFYSFMNTTLNMTVGQTMTSGKTPAARAKLAADYLLLLTVPAVLGALLKDALTPGDAGDDDPEKLAKKLAAEQLSFLMGLMVVVREFANAGKTVAGLEDHARDYSGPAGLRLVSDAQALAKQVGQVWQGGEFDDAFRKAFVNLSGDLLALPAAQINRTVTGIQALRDGKISNPAALVFGFQEPH